VPDPGPRAGRVAARGMPATGPLRPAWTCYASDLASRFHAENAPGVREDARRGTLGPNMPSSPTRALCDVPGAVSPVVTSPAGLHATATRPAQAPRAGRWGSSRRQARTGGPARRGAGRGRETGTRDPRGAAE